MKFETLETFHKANGSSLKGHLPHTTYDDLVCTFGQPTCDVGDGYKTDCEWLVEFEDGTIATIYNWKNGYNYCGVDGKAVEDITHWNVGGHDGNSYLYVVNALADRALKRIKF